MRGIVKVCAPIMVLMLLNTVAVGDYFEIPPCAWERDIGDVPTGTASSCPDRGVALGGFGAGSFMYSISGSFGPWSWDIASNGVKSNWLDGGAFHIYEKKGAGASVTKCLSTRANIKSDWNKIAVGDGKYYALQPMGWCTYPCFDADVSQKFFSPIMAQNYKETSYPVAVWQFKLSNPTDEQVTIAILLTWQNVGNPYLNNARSGFANTLRTASGNIIGIVMKATAPSNPPETKNSEWCIATRKDANTTVTYVLSWNSASGNGADIWNDFSDDGELSNSCLDGSNSAAALAVKTTLAPGESKIMPFIIAWDFPVVAFGGGTQWWKKYTEYFGRDSDNSFDVAAEALNNYSEWEQAVLKWMNPFITNTNLPDWLKCSAFNELYYNQFGGVFYESGLKSGHDHEFKSLHEDDHKHFVVECQAYFNADTLDVRYYSTLVFARFWPEIERDTLRCFADAIIYQNYDRPGPPGVAPHHAGNPDSGDPYFQFVLPWNGYYWKDHPSKFILQCWRYYYLYRDRDFLNYVWPACEATYEFLKTTDSDGDFLPNNEGADQTYDTWGLYGTSLLCGGLWVAALEAMQKMAQVMDDPISTEVDDWLTSAKLNLDSELWYPQGGYYKIDTESDLYGGEPTAIMSDGLNAQRYCEAYGLGDVLPKERMCSHFRQVYERCVVPLHDYTGDGIGDIGAINGKKEDGSNLGLEQPDEIWTGTTYFLAASMYHAGLEKEAIQTAFGIYYPVYEAEDLAYWFNTPEGWNEPGTSPRPTNPEQYQRPRAVWELVFEICYPPSLAAPTSWTLY